MDNCPDPQRTLNFTCNENLGFKDCGQLKDSRFKNFGCQEEDSKNVDYFECSNRMDKQQILFKEPPVPKNRTEQGVNYNVVLNFTDEVIHCGDFDIPWTKLKEMRYREGSKMCSLKNGREVSLSQLWLQLLQDYSYRLSPKMNEL